jgi:pyrimidine operon attenuation protein/uracil phosphoribosyltransferase
MADVAKRVHVTLPDNIHRDLELWAEFRGQAIATAAAVAIELAMREAKDRGEIPPPEQQGGDK